MEIPAKLKALVEAKYVTRMHDDRAQPQMCHVCGRTSFGVEIVSRPGHVFVRGEKTDVPSGSGLCLGCRTNYERNLS
jgi:hypothetical protein